MGVVTGLAGGRTKQGRGRQRRNGGGAVAAPERLEGRLLLSGTWSAPVVDVVWKGQAVHALQDQWVVSTANADGFQKLAQHQGFTAVQSLGRGFYQFTSTDTPAQVQRLSAAHPLALGKVQPNRVSTVQNTLPDDAELPNQWGIQNTGQLESFDYNNDGIVTPYDEQTNLTGLPPGVTSDFPTTSGYPDENQVGTVGSDIDAQQAWDVTTGLKSVVVAVLDTGIDTTHPDLVGNLWTNPLDTAANGENGDGYAGDIHGYNFVAGSADVTDDNGHGTAMAGIIGASGNNGIGITGVNWNVSVLPVKVADAGGNAPDSAVIAGINYVINLRDHGVNVAVMNESFAGSAAFPVDALEAEATNQAGRAGIVSVVAAGNTGVNIDRTGTTPAGFSASQADVITVAAVDNQGKLAAFSNFGAQRVDIAAPGVNIFTTLPTYPFVEMNDPSANQGGLTPAYYLPPPTAMSYGYDSGTSEATSFVTGTIALEAATNPSATPAELKAALLQSATYDPNLAAANGLAAKVATSGVVNAYHAVLAIRNPFVGTDASRQGSWVGYYGSQGGYVVGDSTAFPTGFVNVTTTGGAPVIVQNTTNNPAALQKATDPSERLSAYQGSATSETINLAFTDGAMHRTRLYVVDPDHKRRTETVSIVDAATGITVDTRQVSDFTKGEYLTWDLQGSVDMVITSQGGGAAYSGLFFDAPDVKPTTFYNLDANTFGSNWRNTYGSQGYQVFGDASANTLPTYVSSFGTVGGTLDVLRTTTRNIHALQRNTDYAHNIEAYEASATNVDVNVAFSDTLLHTVTLYLADYTNQRRTERVQAIDAATGNVLVTQDVTGFKNGVFVSFNVAGAVTFRVIRTGGPDAVVSGVFFDAPFGENGHFDGTDLTTSGNWKSSQYGNTAAFVIGDDFPGYDAAADARVSITGGTRTIVRPTTADGRALLRTGVNTGKARVEAYASTTSSLTVNYTPADTFQHKLSLYFADYENFKRVETVSVIDTATNTVIDNQVLTNFSHGKYLTYDVSAAVKVVIRDRTYPNAVVSGVFLD